MSESAVIDTARVSMLVRNYSNFKRSGPPLRVMYYEDGSWVDFPSEVVDSLQAAFLERKAVVEVGIGGDLTLFDLYRMCQVDLEKGRHRSISWIDLHGKCFFPETFVVGGGEFGGGEFGDFDKDSEIEVTEELSRENQNIDIEIRIGGDSTKRKKEFGEIESEESGKEKGEGIFCNDQPRVSKRRRFTDYEVESPRWPKAKLLNEQEKAYSIVKSLFLSGIGTAESGATITSVHQCMRISPLDRARYEVFQMQMEITKAARGDANMTFAWYGTSAKGVASILSHGFAMPTEISGSEAHGLGIYLSPVRSPHISDMFPEVDDNGEKHVILCRVILGKCEKVEAGSRQMFPSSVDFDTGVDDLKNPKRYVVWCSNMNTYILPECVVSYKHCSLLPSQFGGSSFVKPIPDISTVVFAKLLSKMGSSLPSSRIQEFRTLWRAYKDGKVAKDAFMKHLRSVVGDDILNSVLREVRG